MADMLKTFLRLKNPFHSPKCGRFGGKHMDFCTVHSEERDSHRNFCNKSAACEFTLDGPFLERTFSKAFGSCGKWNRLQYPDMLININYNLLQWATPLTLLRSKKQKPMPLFSLPKKKAKPVMLAQVHLNFVIHCWKTLYTQIQFPWTLSASTCSSNLHH